jgi:hypothetical protein
MIRKLKRKIKKTKVRDLVPDAVVEKATNLVAPQQSEPLSLKDVPQITDKTIAVHREEVLKGARKYIYPLAHSKKRIVTITIGIVSSAIVGLLIYCSLALYHFYQYNTFLYRITQVVPFPIAHLDGKFVSYESYLFELRHYVHYYQSQSHVDFSTPDAKQQLIQYREQALQQVTNDAYIKILASKDSVSVSDKEVNARITEVRNQNRLGGDSKVFADVLRDYWGWSITDFKRSLKQEILAEKVVAKLDTADTKRANDALTQLKGGADFAGLAKQISDDPNAKNTGGDYGFAITKNNPNIPPQVIDALFKLKPGQISGVVDTGSTLEIVKLNQVNGDSVTAWHIVFNLKDVSTYLNPLKTKYPAKNYVHF